MAIRVASGPQPVEDRAGEGADARAIFDEQLGVVPVDRLEHLVDQHRLDGMTEPTITGFFRKPRRNCQCGLRRAATRRTKRRGPFSVRADETVIDAPKGAKGRALAKAPGLASSRARLAHTARTGIFATVMRSRAEALGARGSLGTAMSTTPLPAALCGDAGRGGGQYGAAVGHAGDRAGDRHRRFLGGGRLHLVGGPVGRAGALLGAQERPSWPQGADPAGRRRLHRLDAAVRACAGCRA